MQAEQLDGSRSNLNLHCLLGEERTYPLDVVEHGSAVTSNPAINLLKIEEMVSNIQCLI